MENQDLDLIGQTVGNMPYKIGIVDKDGSLKNQFVANASTNRIDIPQSILGTGGSSTGGNTGGTAQSQVPQIPSSTNLFSGSAVGAILLSGVTPNYDNVQDGLLITLSNQTLEVGVEDYSWSHLDLSSVGLKTIKIPKEKLIVGNSFDISDQLSQYTGKKVNLESRNNGGFASNIASFGGATIQVLPNITLSMNLTVSIKDAHSKFPIPVIQVNTYKN